MIKMNKDQKWRVVRTRFGYWRRKPPSSEICLSLDYYFASREAANTMVYKLEDQGYLRGHETPI